MYFQHNTLMGIHLIHNSVKIGIHHEFDAWAISDASSS